MASPQHPNSPVFHRLFQPALEAFAASETRYLCHRIPDEDYLAAGVLRCLSSSRTGRDFLQNNGDFGALDISVDHFFKAIQSKRRLKNLASINNGLSQLMRISADDPFASISDLDGFAIYAGDGHYHARRRPRPEAARPQRNNAQRSCGALLPPRFANAFPFPPHRNRSERNA